MELNIKDLEGMDFWSKVSFLGIENSLNVLKVAYRLKRFGERSFYEAAYKYGILEDEEKLSDAELIGAYCTLTEIKEAIKLSESL